MAREERLDGKWLLRTSDETLTAADLAAAYRQLYQIERGWRDFKGPLAAAAGVPLPRGPHQSPRAALLAGAAADARGRERHRPKLAGGARGA